MEIRFQRVFLAWLLFSILSVHSTNAFADNVAADDMVPTQIERREVLEDLLDSENFEFGVQLGLLSIEDFESNVWVSGHFAYHINENFYVKALYGHSKAGETSFEKLVNVPPLLTDDDRKLNYYGLNIGYNLLPGEVFLNEGVALNSMLSVELGGGSTDFAGDNQFTVNFTVNYRLFLTDWLTWDIAMSDYIFDTSVTGENKTTHNLNLTTGVAFYF